MNVSITCLQRPIKLLSIGLFAIMAFLFTSTQASAQTGYVPGDQAVQILKNEVNALQAQVDDAIQNARKQEAFELATRMSYYTTVTGKIRNGMDVLNAVETSLPTTSPVVYETTGEKAGGYDLQSRRNQLRNQINQLLIQ